MTTYSSTFSAVGVSSALVVPKGKTLQYSLSATWGTGSVVLEKKVGANGWKVVSDVHTTNKSLSSPSDLGEGTYRLHCLTYQNTITYVLGDVVDTIKEYQNEAGQTVFKITDEGIETLKVSGSEKSKTLVISAANAKAGATAGWVVGAGDNKALSTLPAEQTSSTLVVPISGLQVGDIITGFYGVGQIESAGGAASISIDLRVMDAAAADVADASVDAMDAPLSVTADTIISSANAAKTDLTAKTVAADESYYFLVTATTAASTDIALQALVLNITRI